MSARSALDLARRLVFDHHLQIALLAHRWATQQRPQETAMPGPLSWRPASRRS